MAENVGVLSVTVTAVDKATATINSVRDRVGTVIEPTRQLTAAFGRLSEASGLARVSSGLSTAAGHATSFAKSLAFAAVPLAGGGLIAGATSSATAFINTGRQLLSGARALEMSVPQLHAFQNGARLAGIGAEDATEGLKSFGQVLYDAVGGRNAEAMAASQLPRLGFAMRDASGRARTASDALGDVADSIARLNNAPREQAQLARVYGVEALLPMLRRGRAGVADLLAQGRSVGTLTQEQAEQAKRLERQWDSMRSTGDRLALTVGGALAPAMERGTTRALAWAQANEGTISTALVGRLEQAGRGTWTFVSAVDRAVTSTVGWETATTALEVLLAGRLLKTLTGINAATALFSATRLPLWALRLLGVGGAAIGAQMAINRLAEQRDQTGERQAEQERNFARRGLAGGFYDRPMDDMGPVGRGIEAPGPMGFGSGVQRRRAQDDSSARGMGAARGDGPDAVTSRHQDAFAFFRARGWSPQAAAGITANLHHESGVRHDGPAGDGGMSMGLAQWNRERLTAFREFAGVDIRQSTRQQQLEFIQHELTAGRDRQARQAGEVLRGALSAREAGAAFSRLYERPAGREGEAASRGQTAENMLPRLVNQPAPAGAVAAPSSTAAAPSRQTPAPISAPTLQGSPAAVAAPQVAEPTRTRAEVAAGAAQGTQPAAQPAPTAVAPVPIVVPTPAAPVQSPLDGAPPQRMSGSVDVSISLAGAERGTKVMARGQGIASVAPPRVEQAMLDWDAA
ncbi:phage tail tip lysozyme [Muricoccus aerilatus]|uniref:phage tail tip lysozyme n=1 Tax=Muricoccus aerilatus TaxID=452982 RepID=UPI0005C12EB4|nr:phage tail tip lysozyme [Roseomonas aerilata]